MKLAFILAILIKACLAQMPLFGGCPDQIPSFQNLELAKYVGTWFEAQRFPFIPEIVGSCVSVTYGINFIEGINAGYLTTDIRMKSPIGQPLLLPGYTLFLNPPVQDRIRDGSMQLTLFLQQPGIAQPEISQTYPYKLVDTDYENYTIKYACRDVGGFARVESVWILIREKKYSDTTRKLVLESLARLNINKDLLVPSRCDEENSNVGLDSEKSVTF